MSNFNVTQALDRRMPGSCLEFAFPGFFRVAVLNFSIDSFCCLKKGAAQKRTAP